MGVVFRGEGEDKDKLPEGFSVPERPVTDEREQGGKPNNKREEMALRIIYTFYR